MKCNCGWMCVSVLALVTAAGVATTLRAQPPADMKKGQPSDAAMAEMMKQMEVCKEMGTPGPEHKAMQKMVGTWNADCKFWMDESLPPMTSKGTMVNSSLFDGHFIKGDFNSVMSMPNEKGEMTSTPFSGMMTWGYNNATGKFESTWVDSMSTQIMVMNGTKSADGKVYTSMGTSITKSPEGKPLTIKTREVITVVSDSKHMMEMFEIVGDKPEMKVMEITYTRAK